jgi:hypothetical protein
MNDCGSWLLDALTSALCSGDTVRGPETLDSGYVTLTLKH